MTNESVIVRYVDSGKESVAAFKSPPFSGGEMEPRFYAAVSEIMTPK